MQGFESCDCLDQYVPDFLFFEELFILLVFDDLLVEVSVVCEFHDYAVCEG